MALTRARSNAMAPQQDTARWNDGKHGAGQQATAIKDAVENARAAAQQQIAVARLSLGTAREQARAQLKQEELALNAEEGQRQLTLEQLQAAIQSDAREFQVKIAALRNQSTLKDAERDRIRIGEVEARKPWTRDNVANLRPMPLPPIGVS